MRVDASLEHDSVAGFEEFRKHLRARKTSAAMIEIDEIGVRVVRIQRLKVADFGNHVRADRPVAIDDIDFLPNREVEELETGVSVMREQTNRAIVRR